MIDRWTEVVVVPPDWSTAQGHTMLSMAWNDIQGSVIVLLMNRAELLLLVRVGR